MVSRMANGALGDADDVVRQVFVAQTERVARKGLGEGCRARAARRCACARLVLCLRGQGGAPAVRPSAAIFASNPRRSVCELSHGVLTFVANVLPLAALVRSVSLPPQGVHMLTLRR